jgi:predicted lipoprotein with Yx(FWY)xxD motif
VTVITRFRITAVLVLALLFSVASAAVGVAESGAVARAKTGRAFVQIGNTLAGPLVVNNRGYVLFTFTENRRKQNRCVKIKNCVVDWPPVTTTGKAIAGPGINPKLLRTIPYKGKLRQVTYAGYPLDTYKFSDSAEDSVTNIGIKQFGGPWDAVTATGKTLG